MPDPHVAEQLQDLTNRVMQLEDDVTNLKKSQEKLEKVIDSIFNLQLQIGDLKEK